ncbi:MAG: metallophosphoesterase [Armatimonadetes bacterium]|nr:metallophosphoesterase [Armatimonadota bacterium]
MDQALDLALCALVVIGHLVLLGTVSNRWLLRIRDQLLKPTIFVAHTLAWLALPWVCISAIGWRDLDQALLFQLEGRSPLWAIWVWIAVLAPVVGLVLQSIPEPRDWLYTRLLRSESRITPIDRAALRTWKARAIARWDMARVETVNLELALPHLPWAFDGFRIAHLSDLHYDAELSQVILQVALEQVRQARPNLIVLTGDSVVTTEAIDDCAQYVALLRQIAPVVAVLGNHDEWADAGALTSAFQKQGVTVLRDRGLRLERGGSSIWLAGAGDFWSPGQHLPTAFVGRREGEFCILLAHNPDHITEAARAGVDLQLSGHTHGGQIAIPVVGPLVAPSRHGRLYSRGLHLRNETLLYVNRGLATHPPVRIGSMPEVTIITLRPISD